MLVRIITNVFFNDMETTGPFGIPKRTGRDIFCRGKTGTNGITTEVFVPFTEPLALGRKYPRRRAKDTGRCVFLSWAKESPSVYSLICWHTVGLFVCKWNIRITGCCEIPNIHCIERYSFLEHEHTQSGTKLPAYTINLWHSSSGFCEKLSTEDALPGAACCPLTLVTLHQDSQIFLLTVTSNHTSITLLTIKMK
jgi:hypothetical protein